MPRSMPSTLATSSQLRNGRAAIKAAARLGQPSAGLDLCLIGGVEVYAPHLMVRLAVTPWLALPWVAVPVSLIFVGHNLVSSDVCLERRRFSSLLLIQ